MSNYEHAAPEPLHVRLYRQLLDASNDGEREQIILALLENPVAPESLHIDCKTVRSDPSDLKKDEKGAFAKAVSGFANGSGGVVLWGVEWKDLGHRENPGKPRLLGVRRCQHLKAVFDSSGKDATDRPAAVENIAIPTQKCEEQQADGIVVSFVPESDLTPHRARWGPSDIMDHYFRRYSDSFRVLTHAELEDMFGVRQRPSLTPQLAMFKPDSNGLTRCVWDVWNFGRDVATAVTLEIRVRIRGQAQQGGTPLHIENHTQGPKAEVSVSKHGKYVLLDCYLPPDAKPIRSVDGHIKIVEFGFRLPKAHNKSEQLRFDWVIGAHSMRPRRGAFTLSLSTEGATSFMNLLFPQGKSVLRCFGQDGGEIDLEAEPDRAPPMI